MTYSIHVVYILAMVGVVFDICWLFSILSEGRKTSSSRSRAALMDVCQNICSVHGCFMVVS